MNQELVLLCAKLYQEKYESLKGEKLKETDAQRIAIASVFENLILDRGIDQSIEFWKAIHAAHVYRKSGISSTDVIEKVTSAAQSWVKSSGHAFEQSICSLLNLQIKDGTIKLVLQRELKAHIDAGNIQNSPRDMTSLAGWIKDSSFDLYALSAISNVNFKVFGCIQCKTSIRERVTRDREPSLQAMKAFFWSSAIVLDGEFLNLRKFEEMVNGGTKTFAHNGWHGAYVFADVKSASRIFRLDNNFSPLVQHLVSARDQWNENRQWLDENWKASS